MYLPWPVDEAMSILIPMLQINLLFNHGVCQGPYIYFCTET